MSRLWPPHYIPPRHTAPAMDVIAFVARQFGTSPDALRSENKSTANVYARAVVIEVLMRKGVTTGIAGRLLGRDHSTVVHARQKLQDYLRDVPDLPAQLERARVFAGCAR